MLMLQVGVKGDLFCPHEKTDICAKHGCVIMPDNWEDPWAHRFNPSIYEQGY